MHLISIGPVATLCFVAALSQSLFSAQILAISDRLKTKRPFLSRFIHFAGEPEIIFGLWAAVFLASLMVINGWNAGLLWLDGLNFSEVAFVFVIMILASTKPITDFAETIIAGAARLFPFSPGVRIYSSILIIGPLLGSLITEPAAMTITAILLKRAVFKPLSGEISDRFFYITLGVLFVNISVGGTLTNFAAPPVLMVARTWEWDSLYMFNHFGWKGIVTVILNVIVAVAINRKILRKIKKVSGVEHAPAKKAPFWIIAVHLIFVVLCVLTVHHPAFVLGLFVLFLGFYGITKEEQSVVRIEESMLVGFFLGGLVILTAYQGWWLKPILSSMESIYLYVGTLVLAPVTDNAAITSLAAQVENLAESSKYLIVSAAVVGGGMTIIANAPNPAGFTLLRNFCPGKNLKPLYLFVAASIPTVIAALIFWFL